MHRRNARFGYKKRLSAAILLSGALLLGASGCQPGQAEQSPEPETPTQAPISTPTQPTVAPVTPEAPEIFDAGAPSGGKADPESPKPEDPEASTEPEETEAPEPEETAPPADELPECGKVPQRDEPVDDSWFDDAAFLGNSLVDGFRLYSGLTNCDIFASTSMTVLGVDSLLSQMALNQYGKVYILLGINEIGFEPDYFGDIYSDMLDKIVAQQPDADIYIMGLSPVSAYKSSTDSVFTMDRVRSYNEELLALAEERGFYYIDLCEALAGEDGYLPSEVTTDGVHFAAGHYAIWRDYLKNHYM